MILSCRWSVAKLLCNPLLTPSFFDGIKASARFIQKVTSLLRWNHTSVCVCSHLMHASRGWLDAFCCHLFIIVAVLTYWARRVHFLYPFKLPESWNACIVDKSCHHYCFTFIIADATQVEALKLLFIHLKSLNTKPSLHSITIISN